MAPEIAVGIEQTYQLFPSLVFYGTADEGVVQSILAAASYILLRGRGVAEHPGTQFNRNFWAYVMILRRFERVGLLHWHGRWYVVFASCVQSLASNSSNALNEIIFPTRNIFSIELGP